MFMIIIELIFKFSKTGLQCSQNANQTEHVLFIALAVLLFQCSCFKLTNSQNSTRVENYCSNSNQSFCIDVSYGNFSTEQAINYCSSYSMSLFDMFDKTKTQELFDILSQNVDISNYSFALNAGRYSYPGKLWDANGNSTIAKKTKDKAFLAEISYKYNPTLKYSIKFSLENVQEINWAICQSKEENCQTITYSNVMSCLQRIKISLSWFEARQTCHNLGRFLYNMSPMFSSTIDKLVNNGNGGSYWVGEWSSFMRYWGDEFLSDNTPAKPFNFTPNWSKDYPESLSTECTFVRILADLTYEWGAVNCNETLEMAVVCQANGSFILPMENNNDLAEVGFPVELVGYIVLGVALFLLVLLCACAVSKWMKPCRENPESNIQPRVKTNYVQVLFSRSRKNRNKSSNSIQKSSETLKYVKLDLPPADEPEAVYSEINDGNNDSSIYSNVPAVNRSLYDKEAAIGYQTKLSQPAGIALKRKEMPNGTPPCSASSTDRTIYYNDFLTPTPDAATSRVAYDSINYSSRSSNRSLDPSQCQASSPLMIVENQLYETQKSSKTKAIIINKLKDIGLKFNRSGSSNDTTGTASDTGGDAANGASPYEPLSPDSLGLRNPLFNSGSSTAPTGVGIYSLETVTASLNDDYARLMDAKKADDNKL